MLTERDLLTKWFPSDVAGEWTPGAELRFLFDPAQSEGLDEADLRGKVLSVEPPRLLEYAWGKSVLRFELVEEKDGCRLIFTQSFDDGSIAARNAAGWEMCLADLEAAFSGAEPAPWGSPGVPSGPALATWDDPRPATRDPFGIRTPPRETG